ncbi:hypothetical protein D3C87_1240860 [compost metagenome]
MNKFSLLAAALIFCALPASALQLKYVGETEIKFDTKFDKIAIGGISALSWNDGILYALSDDKGGKGEPRFYAFDLKIDKKKVTLKPKAIHYLTGLPDKDGKKAGLDPEGMARTSSGNFFISSEGNNNAKPREMPRIFEVKADGKWNLDITLPEKYLPEPTGLQTKGTQNNLAFEGLSLAPSGTSLFTATEGSLFQDVSMAGSEKGEVIRLLKFDFKDSWKASKEYAYRMEPLVANDIGPQVFVGVSEILALSDDKVIVMERGVRISPAKIWSNRVTLYLADLTTATDTLPLAKLADGKKIVEVPKTKLIDFETDLKTDRKHSVENFEALAFGPKLPDGRKTLLVMTDDNFSKTQKTQLLVFAVEGE